MLLGFHLKKNSLDTQYSNFKYQKSKKPLEYEQNSLYNEHIFQECSYVLSMYDNDSLFSLNLNSISINLFREYVTDRLSILSFIDSRCRMEDNSRTLTDATNRTLFEKLLSDKGFKLYDSLKSVNKINPEKLESVYNKDLLSHFLLKLCFINNKEKQDWFIEQEVRFLIYKLSTIININLFNNKREDIKNIKPIIIEKLLKKSGSSYPILKLEDAKNDINYSKIWENAISTIPNSHLITRLIKLPFWPDGYRFIKNRKYYINNGICYVPYTEIENLLYYKYKKELLNSFIYLKENEIIIEKTIFSDQRISSLIKEIDRFLITTEFGGNFLTPIMGSNNKNNNYSNNSNNIKLDIFNIESIYIKSFPLCMRHLYESLRKDRHLKHWSRLQLWLFLKGCGMKLEDQLTLWKSLWTDSNSFDKEIKYNIRHAYGQEGKRSNYSPYPCNKIINGLPLPGNGQNHGCPFKTFDLIPLQKMLKAYYGDNISSDKIQNISNLSRSGHFQLSCIELFKAMNPNSDTEGIGNHPNLYFKKSATQDG
ncbi:hypothetical protein FG386_002684 [Cryptosporidium ryanae]|uniref:uncharacterized protein n=1 Tax=Cryptosporidium ryanae TaxID=515981 RepID=UPI00351A7019|nr:hypothetical protein FG386_002684 [Cryptosporidium ryanae]